MKELYNKHRRLIKTAILIIIVVLIYGSILIIGDIQNKIRQSTSTEPIELNADVNYDEINVDGMTDEEIDRLLEELRNRK